VFILYFQEMYEDNVVRFCQHQDLLKIYQKLIHANRFSTKSRILVFQESTSCINLFVLLKRWKEATYLGWVPWLLSKKSHIFNVMSITFNVFEL